MLLFSCPIQAFNGSKCYDKVLARTLGTGGVYSSAQFTTSTGDCAAIGYHSKENKKLFYVENDLDLQLNIAKGDGVYLSELTSIYGCTDLVKTKKSLMNNYKFIYRVKNSSDRIDQILRNQDCKYL